MTRSRGPAPTSTRPLGPRPRHGLRTGGAGRDARRLLLSLTWVAVGCGGDRTPTGEASDELAYVGRANCASCHQAEANSWQGSHHDLAMQEASETTVLGDFDEATFTHEGVTTTFTRSEDGFHVETEGADGEMGRYDVAYTFGVAPLQQYLIELDGGRLQALSVVWDARPAEVGGQRWYHLYPDEDLAPGDVMHWTGDSQNWNYMCAECHSTALRKGYDLESDTYETTWEEIDVSCEACHGPGSSHVTWAEMRAEGTEVDAPPGGTATGRTANPGSGRYGLTVELGDPAAGAWVLNEVTGFASRTLQPPAGQVETCARCHSRRASLHPEAPPTGQLLDTHLPQTLARGLYYADGQILDEVYVWGSFRQSPMYAAGVRCSDCHESHSLELRAPGNGVCATCHFTPRFDTPEHHFHVPGSEGAACVSCHMPATTYMGVDDRRDHSFRVPRPDVSAAVGSPDACTACHSDRSSGWAADAIARLYGPDRRTERRFGQALHAGREGAPGAANELATLLADPGTPGIVRASAVGLLAERPGPIFGSVLPRALQDLDAQVRATAVRSIDVVPLERRLALAGSLLNDPTLAVRAHAARVLAPVPREGMPPGQVRILERATEEYVRAFDATLDHPSSHVALARLHADQGRPAEAEQSLLTALRIGPWFVPAWINLADLYRSQGREDEGEAILARGLDMHPEQPSLHYAKGLWLTRAGRTEEALAALAEAARLGPDDPRYPYGYALALNGAGRVADATAVLAEALDPNPNDRDLLFALATIHREAGEPRQGLEYARRLVDLEPDNPTFAGLVAELEAAAN